MREIPVSSLGTDIEIKALATGSYSIGRHGVGVDIVPASIPTEALLAIVADRLRDAPYGTDEWQVAGNVRIAIVGMGFARAACREAALSELAQPDADQIGEGR